MKRTEVGAGLRVSGLGIRYPVTRENRWHTALKDVSFEIPAGSFVSIVGPSGCGKTSLLRAIGGLTPHFAGTLQLDGRPITGPGLDRAIVFQNDRLLPWRTVLDNVALGMEVRGTDKATRIRRAGEVVRLVGLEGYEQSYVSKLSGGMRQRVNLARALGVSPEMILLDEPFAALDAQTRELMADELLRIWTKSKQTAVFVTHSIDEAVYLSDRVLVLSRGPESRLAHVQTIELDRPRAVGMRDAPEFRSYVTELRALIR